MSLQQLREKLNRGFYLDNLYEMARICRSMALESENPAPFFIMQKVFSGIADYWDDGPVDVEEAKLVEIELKESLGKLIEMLESKAKNGEITEMANKVVSSYLFLYNK